jgi:rod shape-determining protein MreB
MEPQPVVGRYPSAQRAVVLGPVLGVCAEVFWWVSVHAAKVIDRRLGRDGASRIAAPARGSPRSPYDDEVARDLAIDLGTSNTQVFAKGKGVILEEPTVIALNTRTHEVLAVGDEAWQLIGRTPGYIVAVRPLREGAITDFGITERTIRLLLRRAGITKLTRPRVLICVPSAITSVERRAVKEAARRAGASAAHLIEQPMAAAIGAGLDIHEPVGSMVVDVGGGTTETAVISLGGIVAYRAIRCGGFDMDAAIQEYVRQKHGVAISDRTGEELKIAIGSALPYEGEMRAEARGREIATGHPRTVVLTPEEIRFALSEQVDLVIDTVLGCLGDAPPELAQDIIYEGIHLLGGGARLRGLAERLAEETDVPVHTVADPLTCVVQGAGLCLDSFDSLRPIFAAAES